MFKIMKVSSFILFSIAGLTLTALIVIAAIYGDIKSITTDKNHPEIGNTKYYMDEQSYEKYKLYHSKIHRIGWTCTMVGFLLYGSYRILRNKIIPNKN